MLVILGTFLYLNYFGASVYMTKIRWAIGTEVAFPLNVKPSTMAVGHLSLEILLLSC